MPDRIQLSRKPGSRKPEGAVNVGRHGKSLGPWGNPFRVGHKVICPGRWQSVTTGRWAPVPRRLELAGQRFGKLVVLERAGQDAHRAWMWQCRCDCGALLELANRDA